MENKNEFNPLNENINSLYNRASELARETWDLIRDLPRADLVFIFNALAERFVRTKPERILVALESMRRCKEALGHLPGSTRYDDFRASRPELDLRSAKFIRNTFGASWKNASAAFEGEPIVNLLRTRIGSQVSIYTDEDLIDYVREFIELHSVSWTDGQPALVCDDSELDEKRHTIRCISQGGFRTYARLQENSHDRRFPSEEMINGRFGGWETAIALAIEKVTDAALQIVVRDTITSRDDRKSQLILLLAQCAEELGHPPTTREFDHWRRDCRSALEFEDALAANAWIALRSSDDVVRSFKSWNQGLIAADLVEQKFNQPKRIYATPNHRFSAEELLDWVALARSEVKGRLDDPSFEAWRRNRLDADASQPIPTPRTIRFRFGSMKKAIELAAANLEGGAA